jgi:hypothetical protein
MSYATLVRKELDQAGSRPKAATSSVGGGLRIGDPNDIHEREADRVADAIMTGGTPKRSWSFSSMVIGAPLQRKCSCGGSGGSSGECEECKKKKEQTLQRKALGMAEPGMAPPIVHEVLNSPGQPLDKATRDFFEPRFGQDFSHVRVHADTLATASARSVNAAAYTVGNHIVLGSNGRSTENIESGRLLAHELTHSLQQSQRGEKEKSDFGGYPNQPNITATSMPVLARQEDKKSQTPPPSGLRSSGLTPDEAAQLKSTREGEFKVPASKSTLVGILIDEGTGKRYPVHSGESGGPYGGTQRGNVPRGPGEGFSGGAPTEKNIGTHIEGHAAAIMREQKIGRATLLSPEPPCRVCSSPTKTPAVSVVLPPESRLTVVYPGGAETFWSSALPSPGSPSRAGGSSPRSGGEEESGRTSAKGTSAVHEAAEEPNASTRGSGPVEEGVEGRPTRRIGGGMGAAPEPGFTRALGFAALNFAAGVGTSLLQGAMRNKILSDLAKLPQPRLDRRGASDFLNDPATGPAMRLLDLLGKNIKAFTAAFQPQHQKIMTTAQLQLVGIALLPSKTTADSEKRFARLDALRDEMAGYDEQLSTIQSNLEALLSVESKAMQTKAAADDLIAKLPTIIEVQAGLAPTLGFVPTPDVEEFSKIESNLRFISSSIGVVFSDAHAAKTVIDKAVDESATFRADLSKIWWNEFGAQLAALSKEKAGSGSAAQVQRPPAQSHATGVAQPQGLPLLPTPGPRQQAKPFEPLPGAPGPSPFREVEDRKALFAKRAGELIARGNQLLSSSPGLDQIAAFKRDEGEWRDAVTAWLKHYRDKGPDTGVSAMDELLNSDQYGGRLKQIRQTLAG